MKRTTTPGRGGDAPFVVVDPYWYTTTDIGQSGDIWAWAPGRTQHDWLKGVLQISGVRYKFVSIHHIWGVSRGMTTIPDLGEWGDQSMDATYQFDAMRPR